MRKFQYVLTVDLDDDYLSRKETANELKKVPGIDINNPIYSLAADKFPDAIVETLCRGIGDSGETKITVTFAGEAK